MPRESCQGARLPGRLTQGGQFGGGSRTRGRAGGGRRRAPGATGLPPGDHRAETRAWERLACSPPSCARRPTAGAWRCSSATGAGASSAPTTSGPSRPGGRGRVLVRPRPVPPAPRDGRRPTAGRQRVGDRRVAPLLHSTGATLPVDRPPAARVGWGSWRCAWSASSRLRRTARPWLPRQPRAGGGRGDPPARRAGPAGAGAAARPGGPCGRALRGRYAASREAGARPAMVENHDSAGRRSRGRSLLGSGPAAPELGVVL